MRFHMGESQDKKTVDARVIYGDDGAPLRAVCGRPATCPGLIGTFHQTENPFPDRHQAPPWEPQWYLQHPNKYRPDGKGYAVLRPEKDRRHKPRRGSFSSDDAIRSIFEADTHDQFRALVAEQPGSEREVKGTSPHLPALVRCWQCGHPNKVELPQR